MPGFRITLRSLVLAAVCLALSAGPASADANKKKKDDGGSYWSISFLGGVLLPQRNMKETHKQGLAAGGRLGWTSEAGLGLYLAGDYSPLPRKDTDDPLESFDTHFGILTLQPTFTVRIKSLRLWVGAGAGIAAEKTRRNFRDMAGEKRTEYAPVATGVGGIEVHLFSGGGLVVTGSYSKLFDKVGFVEDRTYKLVNVTGGLVFAFR